MRPSAKRGLALCAALMALAACGSDADRPSQPPRPAIAERAAGSLPTRVRWVPGQVYRHAMSWTVDTAAALEGTERVVGRPIEGRIELVGDLVIRAYEGEGEESLLAVSLENLQRHVLTVAGQALLPEGEAGRALLTGHPAIMRVDRRGRLGSIAFTGDVPEPLRYLLRGVWLTLQFEVPAAPTETWTASQPTLYGTERIRYEVDPADGAVHRHRQAYERFFGLTSSAAPVAPEHVDLTGEGHLVLAPAGHLVELSDTETTTVPGLGGSPFSATSRLELRLTSEDTFDPAREPLPSGDLEAMSPTGPDRAAIERAVARSFADGLTSDDLAVAVRSYSRGVPLVRGMMLRMVGLVRSDDRAARGLAALFVGPGIGPEGRAMVADILSSAGTPVAQETLVESLQTPVARGDIAEYGMLLQRMSLVRRPTEASADFVVAEIARSEGAGQRLITRAAIFSLGSVVGHFFDGERYTLAADYAGQLREGIHTATDPEFLVAYLAAFGNMGQPSDLSTMLRFRRHASSAVRAQLATSLRDLSGTEARLALIGLAGDPASEVALRAIQSLGAAPPSAETLDALAAAIRGDLINAAGFATIRTLIAQADGHRAERIRVLEALLEKLPNGRERSDVEILLGDLRAR